MKISKKSQILTLSTLLVLTLNGCAAADVPDHTENQTDTTQSHSNDSEETTPDILSEYFSERDFDTDYDASTAAFISLEGDSASCPSDAVQISDSAITILDEGTYILSGTLNNGMIIVNADKTDKIQLVLNEANIHSESSAAIYVLQSDKVFITTASDTGNILSNGGTFTPIDDNNIDAVLFSKEDLTLNGSGSLIITSPGGHGIVSKDSLTITSGAYDINCASTALSGKDDICIADGSFTIVSGKDGIHAENADDPSSGFIYIQNGNYEIAAEGDGISSASALEIADGTYQITSGGGSINAASHSSSSWGNFMGGGGRPGGNKTSPGGNDSKSQRNASAQESDSANDSTSMKGIKASADLMIHGGTFIIDSADDSVHSNMSATVNGGNFDITSGDDAFHADDTLTITNGSFLIRECYEGLEGLHVKISGGEITLTSDDDGINAAGGTDASGMGGRDARFGHGFSSSNGSIAISGGTINITAYGDGIDANGTFEITDGHITVCGPIQGDTSTLDYDISASIANGTFIGTGSSFMAQTFSSAEQGIIAVRVNNQTAHTAITLSDADGNVVLTHTPTLDFAVVILSSPHIISGENYQLTMGNHSYEITAD